MTRVFTSLLSFILILATIPALAQTRGSQYVLTDQNTADSLLTVLENSIWAKDGESEGKIAYVIYSTECGWSRQLFEDTRGLQSDIELRWIPAGVAGADYVAEQRTADAVAEAFAQRSGEISDQAAALRAVEYNRHVLQSVPYHLGDHARGASLFYPTVIYSTEQGVKAVYGNPQNMHDTIAEISSTPDKLDIEPSGILVTRNAVEIERAANMKAYTNRLDEDIAVYGAPMLQGPIILNLKSGYQFDVTGLVKDADWIEVSPYGRSGPMAYVHDPLIAQLIRLDFQERRASGNVTAREDLAVRSHPHPEAPVLYTLDAGYQMGRVAEVELDASVWDVVVVFTDGTKGYIMR